MNRIFARIEGLLALQHLCAQETRACPRCGEQVHPSVRLMSVGCPLCGLHASLYDWRLLADLERLLAREPAAVGVATGSSVLRLQWRGEPGITSATGATLWTAKAGGVS